MTNRSIIAALAIAALTTVAGAPPAWAQDPHEVRVGSSVNITTCVARSVDDDDEFVLTNLVDMPAHPPIAGKVVYWVDDVDRLKQHVGKRIQFNARIKDVDRKEMEFKPARGVVEIEGPGGEVKARPDTVGVAAVSTTGGETTVRTTLVELELSDEPKVVTGVCGVAAAAAETASAAAVTATETNTAAAAAETRITNETRTTAETRAAAETRTAETRTTVAESSTAAASTPPAAVTPPPMPAQTATETTTAARTTTASAAAATTERTELPRTATAMPLVGLLGLASLVAGAALRSRR
jgi:hypothetical protein